jgi:hypothetical protein
MTSPIISPSSGPTISTAPTANGIGQPACSVVATITVDSATTDPTLKSMPPVRMTNVMPTARTTRYALSTSRFKNTWVGLAKS